MQRFKIGTFNLYNLVLPNVTYYRRREYSQQQYQQKKTWLAQQLQRMNTDIIGFQEVFHAKALQAVLKESKQYEKASMVVGKEQGHGPGPVLGLVSRFPIQASHFISRFPRPAQLDFDDTYLPIREFSRPVLRAKVEIKAGLVVTVFVVHLKSKRPIIPDGEDPHDPLEQAKGEARSLIVRAAEATALRHLILEAVQDTSRPVIVLGDVNDSGLAVTSQIVNGLPPWKTLPIEKKRIKWDVLLYNVKDIQARQSYQDMAYSYIHNGYYEMLDHILVSQEFVRQNRKRVGEVEYMTVFNDHLIDETLSDESIPVWQADHGQVVATIRLR
ncbi:endonuclease/exonuclease/phosphatase family protein [Anaerolineales bacterium HSG24]|nr:endonuclease/exonuclease/phosphatase family protein [Anaerolineales bacterium HSG24]